MKILERKPNWAKPLLSSFLMLVLFLSESKACDVCGCGAGDLYFGFMPNGEKHHIGLRYRSLLFDSHIKETSEYASLFRSREQFQLIDLMGRFRLGNRFQAMVLLPYVFAQQRLAESRKQTQGLADGLVQVQYRVLDTELGSPEREWKHQFFAGLGLKMPLGNWKMEGDHKTAVLNPNFQPGTGSWDALLTWQYQLRYKNWMLWQDAQLRKNGENADGHRFGDRATGNLNLMYQWAIRKDLSILPLLGIYGENSLQNQSNGNDIEKTGGYLWMTNTGIQAFYQSWNLMLLFQNPLDQNLGDRNLKSRNRFLFQMSRSF
jgi:hypothetical protein